MRLEKDSLGEIQIPDDACFGIHTKRALDNFISSGEKINPFLIKAYLVVKLAAVETNFKINLINSEKRNAIVDTINFLLDETDNFIKNKDEKIYEKVIVDPYQGGAGTSLNMNINEIICNLALKKLKRNYSDYSILHPIDDVNLSQSTNDTFPAALKIASIIVMRELQDSHSQLQNALQQKEKEFHNILKLGRTQLQDAVPISLGEEFGAYSQAIARDRWRLYNAEERLRSINLGGTAVGNSLNANQKYVMNVNQELKKITGLPIAKAEDLIDATQNLDVFVEVSGLIKAGAVSIIKICNDLRFLSCGPNGGIGELILPSKQAGSSIMPGKINPVILENTIQICEYVKGNDATISNLISQGNLELNAFTPLIAHLFLKSICLLKDAVINLTNNCIKGIEANKERCRENLLNSTAIAAVLITKFGYDKISSIVKNFYLQNENFNKYITKELGITETELYNLIAAQIGYEINDNT